MNKHIFAIAFATITSMSGVANADVALKFDIELLKNGENVFTLPNLIIKPNQEFYSTSYVLTNYPKNTDKNLYNKLQVGYSIALQPIIEPDGVIRLSAKLDVVTKALAERETEVTQVSDATVNEIDEPKLALIDGEEKLLTSSSPGNGKYSIKIKSTKLDIAGEPN